jgi:hypothetical protein
MYGSDANNPTIYRVESPSTVAANTWLHVAASYNAASGVMTLYINGAAVGTTGHPNAIGSTGAFTLGRGRYNGVYNNYWPGSIDDVRVFDNALSSTTVSTIAAQHS